MRLAGSRALVTGASSGIGREVALSLRAAGCSLLVTGRDRAALQRTAEAVGGLPVCADLSGTPGVGTLVDAAAAWGTPELVVHCAGIGSLARLEDQRDEDVERLLSINLWAPVRVSRALLPAMVSRGRGRLVFVTSIAGELGVGGESAYSASKAALSAFAESLRAELTGTGVGVTIVVPGVVGTPFFERRGVTYARALPRPIAPSRVAAALVRAVERDRARVIIPSWLRLPVALQATAPELYSRLAARWG